MGQKASKNDNNTGPSKPIITEPRLPGYWDRLSTQQRIPKPATVTYVENPTVAKLLQSHQTWKHDYNKYKTTVNDENFFITNYNQRLEQLRKSKELEELALKCRYEREIIESNKFTQASSFPKPKSINSVVTLAPRLRFQKENDAKYFSIKKKRRELTDDMVKHIQLMKSAPQNCLLAEIDGVQILGKDIRTLLGLNWLNDEIINAYMTLLVYRGKKGGFSSVYSFNTFFYPKLRESKYSSVRRWTRRVDIFSHDYVIVPVHLGNHWTLCFIDFKQRTISYYDSLGSYHNPHCDILLDYLRDEMKDKKKQEFSDSGWQLLNRSTEGIPQQENCSDCGVFACIYAEHLTRDADLDFGQEHMPYYRDRMIYEITKQLILD